MSNETVTLQVGSVRIEIPAADVAQRILADLTGGITSAAPAVVAPAVHTRRPVPEIGELWEGQGGIYAGRMRNITGDDYHLIVAEGDDSEIEEIAWGSRGQDDPAATSEWDGLSNTLVLVRSEHSHPAAEWATGLRLGGHRDWYLGARRETALCYATVPELFDKSWYWSSTQYSAGAAWAQNFHYGYQRSHYKRHELRARAVRRIIDHSII